MEKPIRFIDPHSWQCEEYDREVALGVLDWVNVLCLIQFDLKF